MGEMVMKIETIENEKKMSEWPVPCLVRHNGGTIVLVSSVYNGIYSGFVINPENSGDSIGDEYHGIYSRGGWTLYDGKVILSNN